MPNRYALPRSRRRRAHLGAEQRVSPPWRLRQGRPCIPKLGKFVELGLPFGPKPRLILAHINTAALKKGHPEIDTARSLTSFISGTLDLASHGRNVRVIKDQLTRLSACSIRLGMVRDGEAITVQSQIVTAFSLWLEKDDRQRVLWPSTIRLSADYFDSLQRHAVPLDEHHLAALSHSAMALDVYAWLAQRLHRVGKGRGVPLPWTAVAAQFGGSGYERIRKFRDNFKVALGQVQTIYRGARVDVSDQGPDALEQSSTCARPDCFQFRRESTKGSELRKLSTITLGRK